MARLQEQLTYFVHNKLSTDKLWQNVKVYLSGHEVCERWLFTAVYFFYTLIYFSLYKVCFPVPRRPQGKENTRSWSSFALRTQNQAITPTHDTAYMAWTLTWYIRVPINLVLYTQVQALPPSSSVYVHTTFALVCSR